MTEVAINGKDKSDDVVKLFLETAGSLDQRLSEMLGNMGRQTVEIICQGLTENRIFNALSAVAGVKVEKQLEKQTGFVVMQNGKWRTVTIQKNGDQDTIELGISKAIAV